MLVSVLVGVLLPRSDDKDDPFGFDVVGGGCRFLARGVVVRFGAIGAQAVHPLHRCFPLCIRCDT